MSNRGIFSSRFRKRWFSVSRSVSGGLRLQFFSDKSRSQRLGDVSLSGARVKMHTSESGYEPDFEVSTSDRRVFVFRAESVADAREWAETLSGGDLTSRPSAQRISQRSPRSATASPRASRAACLAQSASGVR